MKKRIERSLWLIAAVALGIYSLSLAETRLCQVYLDWRFAQTLKPPGRVFIRGIPAAAAVAKIKPAPGEPLGRLIISSINLSAMIAEGVESKTLRRSIGHVPGTALPGFTGNVGLSAHRDTFFRHLGDLLKNDVISIETAQGSFDYLVESTTIVDPDEAVVLRDIGRPTLTLVTCYPFYYVGPAPKRFVVHAALMQY
jgi:sortase A